MFYTFGKAGGAGGEWVSHCRHQLIAAAFPLGLVSLPKTDRQSKRSNL